MDDTRNPKSDPSPIFISPADLPLDLEPPLFMTKRASSEDFHMNCADIFHATPSHPTKKRNVAHIPCDHDGSQKGT